MSATLRPGRIADPVHGYVDFTGIERLVLKHRVAQRLRYVAQNGLAHLVFPEVRTSRFSHSLGAMHLASNFLAASLKNTDEVSASSVAQAVQKAVVALDGVADAKEAILGVLKPETALIAHHAFGPDEALWLLIAEQGLRLAALFHDLGHLPFSHDFEEALAGYWAELDEAARAGSPLQGLLSDARDRRAIHERIGHALAQLVLEEVIRDIHDEAMRQATTLAFAFARAILTAEAPEHKESPHAPILTWLHSLMDGEIDVDRCDYILRDGRNYGFEFALYDLDRLLDALVVLEDEGKFFLAVTPYGLAAVESFLLARFRSYQYGVRHHKVVQVSAALRYCIMRLLNPANDPVSRFLVDIGSIIHNGAGTSDGSTGAETLRRFASYDDMWFMGQLRAHTPDTSEAEWFNLVCWREAGPVSLWKRADTFPGGPNALRSFNALIPERDDSAWRKAIVSLRDDGVLVTTHYFSPWKVLSPATGARRESVVMMRHEDGRASPISHHLPLLATLWDVWEQDVHVHASARSTSSLAGKAEVVLDRLPASVNTVKPKGTPGDA